MIEGPKLCENLFFAVTCISIFTCTIRADYNFAMGLLCYYLIKNHRQYKMKDAAKIVSKVRTNTFIAFAYKRHYNRYGHPLVCYHALSMGWKTSKEPAELDCF